MNRKKKVLSVVGARPQFVKAAMLSNAWVKLDNWEEIIVHTGQHYDDSMSKVFFEQMKLPVPKYNLESGSGRHGAQTGKMLASLEEVMMTEQPDWVVVYGDTNSTLAGALAASKLHIPVAHVEAGLRSFNRKMPEEINRLLVDQLATILFTPTSTASEHLLAEGYDQNSIYEVGDVMYDACLFFSEVAQTEDIYIPEDPFALVTIHRAENTDDPKIMESILKGLESLSNEMGLVWPIHPRTKKLIQQYGLNGEMSQPPVGYFEMLALMKSAQVVVTDSGGVQKEAFFCGTPCVTCRRETEWVELVNSGWNRLADPADSGSIPAAVAEALKKSDKIPVPNFYGDGTAAQKMVEAIVSHPSSQ